MIIFIHWSDKTSSK